MNNARARPTARTAATISFSACLSCPSTALPSPAPVRNAEANWAACESTASTMETTRDHLYGRRNPSKRANVRLYGIAAILET
jgi:hypothetical protein